MQVRYSYQLENYYILKYHLEQQLQNLYLYNGPQQLETSVFNCSQNCPFIYI